MFKTIAGVPLVAILVGALSSPVQAQQNWGNISGVVNDTSEALIVGASIVARNEATGVESRTMSNSAGRYIFSTLPVGSYTVTCTYHGFQTVVQTGARVISGEDVIVNIVLRPGAVTQTITVGAAPPVISTTENVAGTTMVTGEIDALPLILSGDARDAISSVRSMSGINPAVSGQEFDFQNFSRSGSVNGAPAGEFGYYIDGLPSTTQGNETAQDFDNVMPEDTAEVRVSASETAEYGFTSGSVVSITTRSGTNRLHGDLLDYVRNDDLDARNFFESGVSADKQDEFGVAVGGPVVLPKIYNGRDRTFFFATYDGFRYHYRSAFATETVPTQAMRAGDFSQLLGPQIGTDALGRPIYQGEIYDPLTTQTLANGAIVRDPFPNNIIPSNRLSPVSLAFQQGYPLPNLPGTALNEAGQLPERPNVADRFSIKIDQAIGSNQRISFTIADTPRDDTQNFYDNLSPQITDGFVGLQPEKHYRFMYTWSIRPDLLFNLAAGYNMSHQAYTVNGLPSQNVDVAAGLTGTVTPNTPTTSIQGYTGFGAPFQQLNIPSRGFPADVNLTWSTGKHTIKFGAQFFAETDANIYDIGTEGNFSFSQLEAGLPGFTETGSGWASFLLGEVHSGSVSSPFVSRATGGDLGPYVMDQWRVTPKLTVNLGLRYDMFLPMTEQANKIGAFDPTVPNPGAGGRLGALTFWGSGPGRNGRRDVLNPYWKAFGPQVGFVYQIFPGTVIRAHYGVTYETEFAGFTSGYNVPQEGWSATVSAASTNEGVTPAFNWTTGFPIPIPPLPEINPALANNTSVGYVDSKDNKPGMSQNIEFGLERALPGNMGLRVDYIGNLSHGLPTNGVTQLDTLNPNYLSLGNTLLEPINSPQAVAAGIASPYAGFTGNVAQALLPYPQYLGVPFLNATNGFMEFNSLQINLQKRFGTGLTFLVAYTIEKNLDNSSWGQQGWGAPAVTAQTQNELRLLKGLDAQDRSQLLAVSYIYNLPFGPGKRFASTNNPIARELVSGWQFAGILNYYGGYPITIQNTASMPGGLGAWSILNQGVPIQKTSCGNYVPENPASAYLNINAFATPAPFTFGNTWELPSVRGCPYYNENLSLIKSFPIKERLKAQVGVNGFNVFNRHELLGLQTNIGLPDFGQFTSASNPRTVQLFMKLSF